MPSVPPARLPYKPPPRVTPNDVEQAVAVAMENVRSGYNEYENPYIQQGLLGIITSAVECKRLANIEEVKENIRRTKSNITTSKTQLSAHEAALAELERKSDGPGA